MKGSHLLSLLAAALVANAQSGSDSASHPFRPLSRPVHPPVSPSVPFDLSIDYTGDQPVVHPADEPGIHSAVRNIQSADQRPPPSLSVSNSVTTDANGQATTVQVTETFTPTPTSNSSASSSATTPRPRPPPVAASARAASSASPSQAAPALICIAAFFIWKFTRKRMADFDDNENIKWPELNDHSSTGDTHALPVTNTGRAGFGGDLSRTPSVANTYNASSVDLNSEDPYAVPPLPHMNPAQPYRDDPAGRKRTSAVHGAPPPEWGQTEAIPMTQMGRARVRRRRMGARVPGPQAAYGRSSPGPQAAYTGRASPGPQAAYAGRASPGPQGAYAGQ
ncbi:hypothetical protein B0H11DRAFT_2367615 [Mycena galericulata]|nr:hypothetical protein B0H11DRAFT_2367615 [Mycena galericulata]